MDAPDLAWRTKLQLWVFTNIVVKVVEKDTEYAAYLDQDAMKIWAKAVTHETYDLTENYEALETHGDKIFSACAVGYFREKNPNLSPKELSEMNSYYTSDVIQTKIAEQFGIADLIRVGSGADTNKYNILGDVLEGIFGAMHDVTKRAFRGKQYDMCNSLFHVFYKDVPIDATITGGNYKTQVIQMFDRNVKDQPKSVIEEIDITPSRSTVVLRMSPDSLRTLTDAGARNIPNPIGVGSAVNKKGAMSMAYKQALENLNRMGATTQWAENIKITNDLNSEVLRPLVEGVGRRLVTDGFNTFTFKKSNKMSVENYSQVIMMIGVRPDGTKKLIAALNGSMITIETKRALLQAYIDRTEKQLVSLI